MTPSGTWNEAAARRLHRDSFVFDGHNDLAGPLRRGESLDDREGRGHLDLARMAAGGLDGGIFAVWVDPDPELSDPRERTLEGVRALHETLASHPRIRLVLTAGDAAEAARSRDGRVAAVIGVEGAYGVDGPDMVDALFEAGMRCLTLTWNDSTDWADAAGGGPHGGLAPLGRRLCERLQRLGVLIDVSHASDDVVRQVTERAERPVVASHSGMRRLAPLPRNLADGLLDAIAETGGLVGISFFSGHLSAEFEYRCAPLRARTFPDSEALARAVREEVGTLPMSSVVEHVRHAVRIGGPEHVGLGSDYDGMWAPPEGLEDVGRLPDLSAALAGDGVFDAGGLTAFLGANWLRVLEKALP